MGIDLEIVEIRPQRLGVRLRQAVEGQVGGIGLLLAPHEQVAQPLELRRQRLAARGGLGVLEAGHGHERARAGLAEDVAQLVLAELHGHRAEDQPEARAGEERHHALHRIRQLRGEHVVLAQAQGEQTARQPVHQTIEFAEREPPLAGTGQLLLVRRINDGLVAAGLRDGSAEHVVHGSAPPPSPPLVFGYPLR